MRKINIFTLVGSIVLKDEASGALDKVENKVDSTEKKLGGFGGAVSKVGDGFGKFGKKATDLGGSMTRRFTAPILAGTAAVAGLVGGMGAKRLVAMDNAQAKLKGIGIEGEQLEEVMKNVVDSVTGTTHMSADAADVAAGALAAGVKEGKELEKYLTIVGDSATAANVPMNEMAPIFARVQSAGKLTRDELEMINHRLPGFSNKMQEHLGVKTPDAFYEMLRSGEVTSEQLMDVMEDHAGGASEAYAETWDGIKSNVMANIGILGETILGELFEDAKEGMGRFLEFLESDEAQKWAEDTGKKLREIITGVVEFGRDLKEFWDGLSPPIQEVIKKVSLFGGAFLAIGGPVILIVGKMALAITSIIGVVSKLIGWIKLLGPMFSILTGPVGLVVAAIAALVAIGVLLYKNWDTIKEKGQLLIGWLDNNLGGAFGLLWDTVKRYMTMIWELIQHAWEFIKEIFSGALDFIKAVFKGDFEGMKDAVMRIMSAIWTFIKDIWNTISEFFLETLSGIWEFSSGIFTKIKDFIAERMAETFESIKEKLNNIKEFFHNVLDWIDEKTNGKFSNVIETVKKYMGMVEEDIKAAWDFVKKTFNNTLDFLKALVRGDFQGMKDAISNQMDNIKNFTSKTWKNIKSFFSETIGDILSNVTSKFRDIKDKIWQPVETAKDKVKEIIDKIKGFFNNMKLKIPDIPSPKMPDMPDVKGGFVRAGGWVKDKVSWNAKGGIFDEPTIFNTSKGLQGVGEDGPEAIMPLDKLRNWIGEWMSEVGQHGGVEPVKISPGALSGLNRNNESRNNIDDLIDKNNEMISILSEVAEELRGHDRKLYESILEAINDTDINWNDREIARVVRSFV